MTDRELLELAAKAYWGDEIDDVCSVEWSEDDHAIAYTHGKNQDHNGLDVTLIWNPIDDDRDALRLAVMCGITPQIRLKDSATRAIYPVFDGVEIWEPFVSDPNAATRRAIVRAAAEIGKSM